MRRLSSHTLLLSGTRSSVHAATNSAARALLAAKPRPSAVITPTVADFNSECSVRTVQQEKQLGYRRYVLVTLLACALCPGHACLAAWESA